MEFQQHCRRKVMRHEIGQLLNNKMIVCKILKYNSLYAHGTVADLHTKVSGARPPPTGPNSFVFTYHFTEKCLCRRLVPPPTRVGAPPTGNPGSAPVVSWYLFAKTSSHIFMRLINNYYVFQIVQKRMMKIFYTWLHHTFFPVS